MHLCVQSGEHSFIAVFAVKCYVSGKAGLFVFKLDDGHRADDRLNVSEPANQCKLFLALSEQSAQVFRIFDYNNIDVRTSHSQINSCGAKKTDTCQRKNSLEGFFYFVEEVFKRLLLLSSAPLCKVEDLLVEPQMRVGNLLGLLVEPIRYFLQHFKLPLLHSQLLFSAISSLLRHPSLLLFWQLTYSVFECLLSRLFNNRHRLSLRDLNEICAEIETTNLPFSTFRVAWDASKSDRD